MVKMNSQTKIIVATAIALTGIDLSVRYWMMQRVVPVSNDNGVITAREIRLVDDNGNLRAHMTIDENNEPGMIFYDRNGVNRLQLDTWDNVPSLILNRPDGQRSTYYGMDTDGKARFDMFGDSGETLTSLNVLGGSPTFFTANGNTVLSGNRAWLTIK